MAFLTRRLERDGYRGARISLELTVAEDDDLAEAGGQPFLQVPDEAGLLRVYEAAREAGLEVNLITDSGRTEFHGVPTMTAVALGPDYDEKIDPVTGGLELY
jgi:PTH2 family peptidyl-tRNA hydrolase